MMRSLSCLALAFLLPPLAGAQEEGTSGLRESFAAGTRCRISEVEGTQVELTSKGSDWGNRKHAMSWENRRRYLRAVEEVGNDGRTIFRRDYELSEKLETQPGRSKPDRTATSAAGQTVRVALSHKGIDVLPGDRLLSEDDRSSVRRWTTLQPYLPGSAVAVGDRWTMDRKQLGYLFFGEAYNERDFVVRGEGTLKRVTERRGRRLAECAIDLTLENPRVGDFPAMRIHAQGILRWDVDGERCAGMELKGPIRLETTMPTEAGKIDVVGEGIWRASIEVDWIEGR